MKAIVFDNRSCTLGEGPLWHPLRKQLFWFDIVEKKLLTNEQGKAQEWQFDETVSAAGWIDRDSLLMASATGLWRFHLNEGKRELLCPLEEDDNRTRSNDGRADPWGGFWIGTMGYDGEAEAGAIYRFYKGELKKLFDRITISNAICFAPDRSHAYFTDTATGKIMKVALDREGWPQTAPEVFVDLASQGLNPDGAVTDATGTLWVALWGAGRVAGFNVTGAHVRDIALPALQTTCPAFGGADLTTLYVTSAARGLSAELMSEAPQQGMTFAVDGMAPGLPEPQVLL